MKLIQQDILCKWLCLYNLINRYSRSTKGLPWECKYAGFGGGGGGGGGGGYPP